MMDLISRDAAIDAVNEWFRLYVINRTMSNVTSIQDILRQLPSSQPERKKGKWLRYGEDGYPNSVDTVHWQCDQCLESYFGRTKRIPNYCPNCGADMRGEQGE